MKTIYAAAISGALLATSILLLPSPAVAVDTCHGQPATVTVDAGGHLLGTPLADVIVAHDGQTVDAGSGDDLICLVGTQTIGTTDAGPGDDTVDATLSRGSSFVLLGLGEDTFVGGPGRDTVHGAAAPGSSFPLPDPLDTERDVISTGSGDDLVSSGSLGAPNLDQLATGAGDDQIHLSGLDHGTSLNASSGRNTAFVTLASEETTAWLVDVGKRTIHFDEATSHWRGRLQRWHFELADGSARSSLVFVGTPGDEVAFARGPGLVPHFRMSGGDDRAGNLDTPGGTYRLGGGRDTLTLGRYDDTAADFPLDLLEVDLRNRAAFFGNGIASPVHGVESLIAKAGKVRASGSLRGEKITAHGCDVVVRGRAGADMLVRGPQTGSACEDLTSAVFGGLGDDRLRGSDRTDDALLGGAGFDRARGLGGIDTCRAEVRRGCEKR